MKIKAIYDKTKFNHFTEIYKKANTNNINCTEFSLVGICDLKIDTNKNATIQFNNIKLHYDTKSYWDVTEQICIQFDDNSSLFALNYYRSSQEDGTYENNKKYIFNIISGTGKFVNSKGTIKIVPDNNFRKLTIKIF
jgi:hypothetical protein